MTHLLVTNDFPPKVGGIQSYLFELWRRLPAERFAVLTLDEPRSASFDRSQPFAIRRVSRRMLLPSRAVRRAIEELVAQTGATHVVLDPVVPIGLVGPKLTVSYSLIAHGAEVTVQRHLPLVRSQMRMAIRRASSVVAAGPYPEDQVRRIAGASRIAATNGPRVINLPPGVDVERFSPASVEARNAIRRRFGVPQDARCVVSVSRLVPRKGMDVLIRAVARLQADFSDLVLVVGGEGRDRKRLEKITASLGAPVSFLGRVSDEDLPDVYRMGDVMAMLCRDRWFGLEQEGFGIVFLEASASGLPVIAGRSGGAADAVVDGTTGYVVTRPRRVAEVVQQLRRLLADDGLRQRLGEQGRSRTEREFDYRVLAQRLDTELLALENER